MLGLFAYSLAALVLFPEGPLLLSLFLAAWDIAGFLQWVDGMRRAQNVDQYNQNAVGAAVMAPFDAFLTTAVLLGPNPAIAVVLFGMVFAEMLELAFGS